MLYLLSHRSLRLKTDKATDMFRIGIGYDTHRLVQGRPLILGGVVIPYGKGLKGHSDGDVLLHAITDALLGALQKGDIGKWFPDTEAAYKDADSGLLLQKVVEIMEQESFCVTNVDSVVICQSPKIGPHTLKMEQKIATILGCKQVNVKATTTEKMNAEGMGKCISAQAVVLLECTKGSR